MAAAYPGANNTYLISHEATNKLVVEYSRNPASFALAKYAQIVPVKKQVGAYLKMTAENAARILDADLKNFVWADGAEANMGNNELESLEWDPYRAIRYNFPYNIGDLTSDQAGYDILALEARFHAQQAMTARTVKTIGLLTTGANWPTANTKTATVAGGGKWDVSAVADKFIKKGLNYAALVINQATLGVVQPKDMILVVSPELASEMAQSAEIHEYIKESPAAKAQIEDGNMQNGKWGLPATLYGYPVTVEDAVKVTTKKGASALTRTYVLGKTDALMLSRPGGLEGHAGGPSFATVSLFMMEEMTVESKHDVDNRRTAARVVENYAVELTAPTSGFLFTECAD